MRVPSSGPGSIRARIPQDIGKVIHWGGGMTMTVQATTCECGELPATLVVQGETDSFGWEPREICDVCHQAMLQEEEEQKYTCRDCKKSFSLKEGLILWKWYDFYAAQGDEPIPVCKDCRSGEKHTARCRKDREDMNWERNQGDFDSDDDNGEWA